MAYIRQRGNQLALVQGARDPETGDVRQHVLFTLYSKPEAQEAIGRGSEKQRFSFQSLIEHAHPEVHFDWKAINRAIAANLDVLPDAYEYRESRLLQRFRPELLAFARQLLLADPQSLAPAAEALEKHAGELGYIRELIDWRLLCLEHVRKRDAERNEKSKEDGARPITDFRADNRFFWRFALPYHGVPGDAEEQVSDAYGKGDYDRLRTIVRLLLDLFPDYADGWNYLGLAAYNTGRLEEAREHFEKTVEVGETLLPKGVRKSQFWSVLETRPYMRGLRNLGLTMIRLGKNEECLALAERLERECGDTETGVSYRAYANLSLRHFPLAYDAAEQLRQGDPAMGFVSAFAAYELGRRSDAVVALLHASLNHPRGAARIVLDKAGKRAASYDEAQDDETGWATFCLMQNYLADRRSHEARQFCRGILKNPGVAALLTEVEAQRKRRHEEHAKGGRDAFDALLKMGSATYARAAAARLFAGMVGEADRTTAPGLRRRAALGTVH